MPPSSLSPLFDEFPSVSAAEWNDLIQEDLGGRDPASVLRWDSPDGVSLPAIQRREDLADLPHVSSDAPASPLASTESNGNLWRIRQNLRHPDPETANEHARTAIENGCTDLGLVPSAVDDHAGLSLDATDALDTILRDLPLHDLTLHFERGPAALALYSALQDKTDGDASMATAYDPVAALATGTLANASTAFDGTASLLSQSAPPLTRPVTVDLRPYHDAGASAVQELAFGLGALSETLHQLTERDSPLPSIVPRLQFYIATGTSYFVEIAKLRALRLLAAQVLDAYAAETDASVNTAPDDLFVQAETAHRTQTLYAPYVNMLRGTTAAMAAVLGGCDVLSVRSYDTRHDAPNRFGTRIARNVQLILREEAHFDLVDDPAAGAYYLETATDRLAEQAWDRFQRLEANGGILDALRTERLQSDIAERRTQRCQEVDDRDRVLVGTNHYPNLDETRLSDENNFSCNNRITETVEPLAVDLAEIQRRLANGASLSATIQALTSASPSYAALPRVRVSLGIERVRLRTERFADTEGRTPTVLLAPLGPAAARSARATFARNVFGVAGFEVEEPLKFDAPADAAATASADRPDIVVLCSADPEYPTLTPALRSALTDHDLAPLLVVAGNPERMEEEVPADDFVHSGMSLRDKLSALQDRLGVPPLNADED